jgi:hypothetical protein
MYADLCSISPRASLCCQIHLIPSVSASSTPFRANICGSACLHHRCQPGLVQPATLWSCILLHLPQFCFKKDFGDFSNKSNNGWATEIIKSNNNIVITTPSISPFALKSYGHQAIRLLLTEKSAFAESRLLPYSIPQSFLQSESGANEHITAHALSDHNTFHENILAYMKKLWS